MDYGRLIELLNEYEQENLKVGLLADKWEFDGNLHYYSHYKDEYVFDNVYYRIISKDYRFIKWLVDNDKIDGLKFYENNEWTPIGINNKSDIDQVYSVYEQLLMLLSISDSPIDDLISYLK